MRKILVLLLILFPLMAGCVNQEPDQSLSTTMPVSTLPPAYYEENSLIEQNSKGAVKQFALPESGYSGLHKVGSSVLLVTDSEMAKLQMLTGEMCIPSASIQLPQTSLEQCVSLSNGFAYYDPLNHSVVYLDSNLNQKNAVELSSDMSSPIISPDGSMIFYCVGQEIRVLDVEKNISRLVKTQLTAKQKLVDFCFAGDVLVCESENSNGEAEISYISSKDGQTLKTENNISELYTDASKYVALWSDGGVQQWVTGSLDVSAHRFVVEDEHLYDAMGIGGIVGYGITDAGLQLNFYQIPDARKKASILLENISVPDVLMVDPWSKSIWLIAEHLESQKKVLLKWNVEESACADEEIYTTVLYTASNPDQKALDELQERVDLLNEKYGVRIKIWQEAVQAAGDHALVPEYQSDTISDMLDQLETVLQEFPKKFVSKSISSRVRICLVRSVDGKNEGIQYWNGRYAFIALCSGSDIREDFLKAFGFVVDSHVLGNSPIYDYWDTLNPAGFRYGKIDENFLSGETRYFVDTESMSTAMTDRSRIFWKAMESDNAEFFQGEVMQKKLTMLCKAIRDAWNLEKKSEIYPWEQYLENPIAYNK